MNVFMHFAILQVYLGPKCPISSISDSHTHSHWDSLNCAFVDNLNLKYFNVADPVLALGPVRQTGHLAWACLKNIKIVFWLIRLPIGLTIPPFTPKKGCIYYYVTNLLYSSRDRYLEQ